jgi:CheY-like chemotaxis protein
MAGKILIVDDDIDTLRLVGMMLESEGFEIIATKTGAKAIELAFSESPDLIILDIMMPELDGYAVTRQLRQDEKTKSIPILIFTAKTGMDDKMLGLELGADVYLTKPISTRELRTHVNSLLSPKDRIEHPDLPEELGGLQAILAAKGGMGVSTITLNTGIMLHRITDQAVIVSDFRPGQGSLALDLGYPHPTGLDRLLALLPEEMTTRLVEAELIDHDSGIRLLLSSPEPSQTKLTSKIKNFEEIAKSLSRLAPYVVLDLGPGMTSLNENILPYCAKVSIVVEPAPQSVSQASLLIQELSQLGINPDQLRLIVFNRVPFSVQLTFGEVEKRLNLKIATAFSPNRELAYQASIENTPIVMLRPEGLTSQQFSQLVDHLI